MYCSILQLHLLALAVAAHAASIATHSQYKRAAPSCQIRPRNYDYQNGQSQSSQNSLQNCIQSGEMSIEYMSCSTPALLTDNEQGPELYNNTNQDQYYHIVHGETDILFTFPQVEIVRDIKLYYYSNAEMNKSLPRVYVHIVNDDFNIGSVPSKSRIAEGGLRVPPPDSVGLQYEIIQVNASSKKWLISFDELQLEHQLYLSEVAFFYCTLPTVSAVDSPPTPESVTTDSHIQSTTTPPPPPVTTSTQTLCTSHNDITAHETAIAGTSLNILPWILVGIMAILCSALLIGNIVCCAVHGAKQVKKRRYELKRNPSYLSTTRRTVDAHNCGFENHIYDVPTT